ncbi:hypothetical protein IVB14_32155 [Bradyrhizobium sp. 180]|nr:hypothetical protein [Bradyrhizobium sp. 180]
MVGDLARDTRCRDGGVRSARGFASDYPQGQWDSDSRSGLAGRGAVRFDAVHSPLHPFFRPAVSAPNETFERHQNPHSRELCLLTQEAGQWDSNQLVAVHRSCA